jgi:hypothetical protein
MDYFTIFSADEVWKFQEVETQIPSRSSMIFIQGSGLSSTAPGKAVMRDKLPFPFGKG